MSADQKIKTTVALTPRQTTEISAESKRLGVSDAEVIRRWIDEKIDELKPPQLRDARAAKLYAGT